MKSLVKFLIIFSVVILGSALLAPFLFNFLPFKFERIFNRLIMIFSLAVLMFYIRKRTLYFPFGAIRWRKSSIPFFLKAFVAGFFVLCLLTFFRILAGNAVWAPQDFTWHEWAARILKAFLSGLLIGFIEEAFFRGFLFSVLRDKFAWPLAVSLFATNGFYSLLHFVGDKSPLIGDQPTVMDSFKLITACLPSFADWLNLWPGALGLFVFGMILNLLFLQTKSLYVPIGLHAGCVFFLKLDGSLIDYLNQYSLIFGTHQHYDGVLGWGFIMMMGWGLSRMLRDKEKTPGFGWMPFLLILFLTGIPFAFSSNLPEANSDEFQAWEEAAEAGWVVRARRGSDARAFRVVTEDESEPIEVPSKPLEISDESPVPPAPVGYRSQAPVRRAVAPEGPEMLDEPIPAAKEKEIRLSKEPVQRLTAMDKTRSREVEIRKIPVLDRQPPVSREPLSFSEREDEMIAGPEKGDSGSYFLADHLKNAEVAIIYGSQDQIEGKWVSGRFVFPELGEESSITTADQTYDGMLQPAIRVMPLANAVLRFRFYDVPAGYAMVLHYGIADNGILEKEDANAYLKIWAGRHLLKRIQVPDQKGWKTERVDFGILSFLDRPTLLTFEITADNSKLCCLGFYPEIQTKASNSS